MGLLAPLWRPIQDVGIGRNNNGGAASVEKAGRAEAGA